MVSSVYGLINQKLWFHQFMVWLTKNYGLSNQKHPKFHQSTKLLGFVDIFFGFDSLVGIAFPPPCLRDFHYSGKRQAYGASGNGALPIIQEWEVNQTQDVNKTQHFWGCEGSISMSSWLFWDPIAKWFQVKTFHGLLINAGIWPCWFCPCPALQSWAAVHVAIWGFFSNGGISNTMGFNTQIV